MRKTLGSDTMVPAFSEVIAAVAAANSGEAASYGADAFTAEAEDRFRKLFNAPVEVRFAGGGTGANVLALASVLSAGQTVVTADTAHIVEHEAGAVSRATGAQIRSVSSADGKLRPSDIAPLLETRHDLHQSQPRVISITQATELGTVYTAAEIATLAEQVHNAGALLHVDGARIANALVATDTTVEEMLTATGVDIVSFGAIKNGTMFGEAVVWIDPQLAQGIKRKQVSIGQLSAKTRYIAAQWNAYFEDDRWLKGARNANAMAQLLAKELSNVNGVGVRPVEANIVWADVGGPLANQLNSNGYISSNGARWVAAWDTTEHDVCELVEWIKGL